MHSAQLTEEHRGRVRSALPNDFPAVARLFQRAHDADGIAPVGGPELRALMTTSEVIVLGVAPNELVAAACLRNGRIVFIVVDPVAPNVESRVRGVARAMCEAAPAAT